MGVIGRGLMAFAGVLLSTAAAWAGTGGGFQVATGVSAPVISVAEPASLALLVVGAGSVLALRRWRNRK